MRKLTVSIPAYNVEKFIEKAIKSVLMQQDVDFELFIVDDCSKDKTSDVVNSMDDKRIKLIQNSKRRGIFNCHNLVIEKSKAPYFMHLDSDGVVIEKLAL